MKLFSLVHGCCCTKEAMDIMCYICMKLFMEMSVNPLWFLLTIFDLNVCDFFEWMAWDTIDVVMNQESVIMKDQYQ
jgi:hypothetical protein